MRTPRGGQKNNFLYNSFCSIYLYNLSKSDKIRNKVQNSLGEGKQEAYSDGP
ncbi:hypothetical protein CLS_38170 [[Clostridium] cf. saccharolyticum K10]|nr:hypothetical protein CLS_38170 [[Clostridium] cf. saccharolyticum K10]